VFRSKSRRLFPSAMQKSLSKKQQNPAVKKTAAANRAQVKSKPAAAPVNRVSEFSRRVLTSFMLPEAENVPVATPFNNVPVSLATTHLDADVSVNSDPAQATNAMLQEGECMALLYPDASCGALVYYAPVDAAAQFGRSWIFGNDGSPSDVWDMIADNSLSAMPNETVNVPVLGCALDQFYVDDYEYAGTIDGERTSDRYVYLDIGNLVVTLNQTGGSDLPLQFFLSSFDGQDEARKNGPYSPTLNRQPPTTDRLKKKTRRRQFARRPRLGSSRDVTIPILERGYYSLSLFTPSSANFSGVTALSLSAAWTSAPGESCLAHQAVPGFSTNAPAMSDYVVPNRALLFTNTTPEIALGGLIVGMQLPVGIHWAQTLSSAGALQSFLTDSQNSAFTAASSLAGSVRMQANKGMFGFAKPSSETDLDLRNDFAVLLNTVSDSWRRIVPLSPVVLISVRLPVQLGSLIAAEWRAFHNIQYSTSDLWRTTIRPSADWLGYQAGLALVRSATQFSENPSHAVNMMNEAQNLARGLGKTIRVTANEVSKTAPVVRKAIGSLV